MPIQQNLKIKLHIQKAMVVMTKLLYVVTVILGKV